MKQQRREASPTFAGRLDPIPRSAVRREENIQKRGGERGVKLREKTPSGWRTLAESGFRWGGKILVISLGGGSLSWKKSILE